MSLVVLLELLERFVFLGGNRLACRGRRGVGAGLVGEHASGKRAERSGGEQGGSRDHGLFAAQPLFPLFLALAALLLPLLPPLLALLAEALARRLALVRRHLLPPLHVLQDLAPLI